jgi:hypothetical protein
MYGIGFRNLFYVAYLEFMVLAMSRKETGREMKHRQKLKEINKAQIKEANLYCIRCIFRDCKLYCHFILN